MGRSDFRHFTHCLLCSDHMDRKGNTYGISKTSGVIISLGAISLTALLVLAIVFTTLPGARNDAIGVLIASMIIPLIALFRPLQEFTILPDGLEFRTIVSKRASRLHWTDVTDLRLRRDVLGITNLEFRKKGARIYKKVPLSIIPERRELLRQLLESFPSDHRHRSLLEHAIHSYVGRCRRPDEPFA